MGEVGRWYGGGTPSKSESEYWQDGTVPWMSPKDMTSDTVSETEDHVAEVALTGTPLKRVPSGSVAFVVRSNILRRRLPIAFVPNSVTLNQDMRALVPFDGILPRYVAQFCQTNADAIRSCAVRTDGSMAAVRSEALLGYRIPIPPTQEQERIVGALDSFDVVVNDLSVGLPAELEARRQQYEYYRDKLLTFDQAPA